MGCASGKRVAEVTEQSKALPVEPAYERLPEDPKSAEDPKSGVGELHEVEPAQVDAYLKEHRAKYARLRRLLDQCGGPEHYEKMLDRIVESEDRAVRRQEYEEVCKHPFSFKIENRFENLEEKLQAAARAAGYPGWKFTRRYRELMPRSNGYVLTFLEIKDPNGELVLVSLHDWHNTDDKAVHYILHGKYRDYVREVVFPLTVSFGTKRNKMNDLTCGWLLGGCQLGDPDETADLTPGHEQPDNSDQGGHFSALMQSNMHAAPGSLASWAMGGDRSLELEILNNGFDSLKDDNGFIACDSLAEAFARTKCPPADIDQIEDFLYHVNLSSDKDHRGSNKMDGDSYLMLMRKILQGEIPANREDHWDHYGPAHWIFRPRQYVQPKKTWREEHYLRMPPAKHAVPKWSNLWGFMLRPEFLAAETFLAMRVMTVYDVAKDIVITSQIDHKHDAWWFWASVALIVLPILAKCVLLRKTGVDKLMSTYNFSRNSSIGLYAAFSFFFFATIDVYLLLFYPWVNPNAKAFATFGRLSPLLEAFIESPGQICLQMSMLMTHGELNGKFTPLMLFSILPAVLNIFYKLYCMNNDAHYMGMSLGRYVSDFAKALFGYTAPFLTLLGTQQTVSYATVGCLSLAQQESIFACLKSGNAVLQHLVFGDENDISLQLFVDKAEIGSALKVLEFGRKHCVDEVHVLFKKLEGMSVEVEIGKVKLNSEEQSAWIRTWEELLARDGHLDKNDWHNRKDISAAMDECVEAMGLKSPSHGGKFKSKYSKTSVEIALRSFIPTINKEKFGHGPLQMAYDKMRHVYLQRKWKQQFDHECFAFVTILLRREVDRSCKPQWRQRQRKLLDVLKELLPDGMGDLSVHLNMTEEEITNLLETERERRDQAVEEYMSTCISE